MRTRPIALLALFTLAAASHAQSALFAFSAASGATPTYVKVSDFGLSRSHELFEGTQGNMRTYQPGQPVFGNLTFVGSLDTSPDMDVWINSLLKGAVDRKSGSVIFMRTGQPKILSFSEGFPVRWSAPECNSNERSKKDGMTIEVQCPDVVQLNHHGSSTSSNQKAWLPANFRLKIEGLEEPCARVNKIEAITVKQVSAVGAQDGSNFIGGDLDGDGLADVVSSNLVFTLPSSAAQAFTPWFLDGLTSRRATIDYNDQMGVSIHRLAFECCTKSVSENLGLGQTTICCTVTSKLIWSPRSN